jgi:ferredoxin--NADP+ reductase
MTLPVPWIEGRVVGQTHWTHSLRSITVACDPIGFEAGQFTRVGLMVDGEILARAYSFVNAPGEPNCEFYYVIVPGGPLTARLAMLEAGDVILVSQQPAGFLVMSEVPDVTDESPGTTGGQGTLWLLSTGTGIGPFLSILATDEPWRRFSTVVLAHGVRHLAELTYGERIMALKSGRGLQFRHVPLLTRDPASSMPGALAGHIPDALRSGALEQASGEQLSAVSSRVMLCGNPGMVAETVAALRDRGLKKHRRRDPGQILLENYW